MEKVQEIIDDDVLHLNTAFTAKHLNEEIEGGKQFPESLNKEKLKTLTVALVICLHLDVDPPDIQKISPCCRTEAWYDPTGRSNSRSLEQIGQNLQDQYERWQPKARYMKCLDPTLEEVRKLCVSLRRNAKKDRVLFHYNGHGVPRPTSSGEIWVFNKTYTKYIPLNLFDLHQWMGTPSLYVFDCHRAGLLIEKFQEIRENSLHTSTGQNFVDSQVGDYLLDHTIILGACGVDEDLSQNPDIPADLFTACLTTPIMMSIKWYWLRNKHRYPNFLESMLVDAIPGTFTNRLSILGELNWIFTAVTDTIAWSSLPKELFQALFRQDLLVATLFRNFLLAERIGRAYDVHPVSYPPIPSTAGHSMWASWDEALDQLMDQLLNLRPALPLKKPPQGKAPMMSNQSNTSPLSQMDRLRSNSDTLADRLLTLDPSELPILHHPKDEPASSQQSLFLPDLMSLDESETNHENTVPMVMLTGATNSSLHRPSAYGSGNRPATNTPLNSLQRLPSNSQPLRPGLGNTPGSTSNAHNNGGNFGIGTITLPSGEQIHYRSATFFCDQLRAFEVWLRTANESMPPAVQLPILLQVLLSQVHRIRALELLCDYVDLGCWAVQHCLAVGLFPYIVRLLQCNINEVKPLIVFLWCKITACAETDFAKNETVRDNGYRYFTSCLDVNTQQNPQTCIMATFVLAQMLNNNLQCQDVFLRDRFLSICKSQLYDNPYSLANSHYIQLRKWLILCLSRLWRKNDAAKWAGVRNNMQELLYDYLSDVSPVVRACAIHALRTFVDNYSPDGTINEHAVQLNHEIGLRACRSCVLDGSPLVRRELVALLSVFVSQFEAQLVSTAAQTVKDAIISRQSMTFLPRQGSQDAPLADMVGAQQRTSPLTISDAFYRLQAARHSVFTSSSNLGGGITRVSSTADMMKKGDSSPAPQRFPVNTILIGNMIHNGVLRVGNVYGQLWRFIILLSHDPYGALAVKSQRIASYLLEKTKDISIGGGSIMNAIPRPSNDSANRTSTDESGPNSPTQPSQSPSKALIHARHTAKFPLPRGPSTKMPDYAVSPGSNSRMSLSQTTEVAQPVDYAPSFHVGPVPHDASSSSPLLGVHETIVESHCPFEELKETQIFQWCAKEFMEQGSRWGPTSVSSSSSISTSTPVPNKTVASQSSM